ncbi:MAG: transposase [Ignavibacteria bacterium]|nr:transposase [Ignavibacteria bacterium]
MTTAQGIGFQQPLQVISETNGFCIVENQRQLTSYAGYEPPKNDSGL